jgi:sugar O-acyltransferase (sialic acid O-acetyltransferase NeuD family)
MRAPVIGDRRSLVIIGDSLFAEIAYEYFTYDSAYDVVAFSVEEAFRSRSSLNGLPIIPLEELARELDPSTHSVYAAITYGQLNRTRTRLLARATAAGFAPASYISSSADVWRNVIFGEHCFVFEDNTLQPFVRIGDNCVFWSGNHIGHHSTIGNNVFVSSHVVVSGSVTIGDNCFLGVNSTIVNNVEIGADVWIGPSVTITADVPENTVWRPPPSELRTVPARQSFRVPE